MAASDVGADDEQTIDVEVKDHEDKPIRTVCGYCGTTFQDEEIVVEKEVHGRMWRFCSPQCYHDFTSEIHFTDEEDPEDADKARNPDF